jgi:hypothetical protein
MDWQPIYSAPRGRRILLWWPMTSPYGRKEIVGGLEVISSYGALGWELPGGYDGASCLFHQDHEFTDGPSHWRELPAPPPGTTRAP